MKLWTVRHPPKDSAGICVGQHRVRLTITQQAAFQKVVQPAPVIPSVIFSSDLPRCEQLASLLAEHWQVEHLIDPRLREISMGDWEGKSYDSLLNDPRWEHWCNNWQNACPPNGESLDDLYRRVFQWYKEHKHIENALLVSHAGVVRSLLHTSGTTWEKAMQTNIPHLTWMLLTLPENQ